jgi:hypothetical protein
MTNLDVVDLRDEIESFYERSDELTIGESMNFIGKVSYELFYVPAKEEWLMIRYINDGQHGGTYVGFASLRDHLDDIEDDLIIETYNSLDN